MNRYALIQEKMPREFVLLQGTGCFWKKCAFCDYHTDVSDDPFMVNQPVLEQVTGQYGVLDVINSGSAMELDSRTIELLQQVVQQKQIHTLWVEVHWGYRNKLQDFAKLFRGVDVKFRTGVETFDGVLRETWRKGIPKQVTVEEVAQYFQGVCLLVGVKGQQKQQILRDIELAKRYFTYCSVNVFVENTTAVQRDKALVEWFIKEVYPSIKDYPSIEILLENTDLGVG